MSFLSYTPTRDEFVYTFGGAPPIRRIRPGTVLKLWSEDAFNGVLQSVSDIPSQLIDLRTGNPQTGPFYVEGAEPGDTLVVHIVELTPARDWAASATIPFFGGLSGTDRSALQVALPEATWIYEVDRSAGMIRFQSRFPRRTPEPFELLLPMAPMLGTVGVAPAGGEVRSALVPDRFGGNMDTPEMRTGTTVFLGVNVEGALLSVGDGHYRQGEGESCGNAVEGAMYSTLIVELIKGGAPVWPRLENDDYWMVVGSARPMEDAWRVAQVELTRWIGAMADLDNMDAYQLLTQLTETPVANVVDPNFSVVAKVAKSHFDGIGEMAAFDGIHQELRRRAATLAV